jgi:hypothetical protein
VKLKAGEARPAGRGPIVGESPLPLCVRPGTAPASLCFCPEPYPGSSRMPLRDEGAGVKVHVIQGTRKNKGNCTVVYKDAAKWPVYWEQSENRTIKKLREEVRSGNPQRDIRVLGEIRGRK